MRRAASQMAARVFSVTASVGSLLSTRETVVKENPVASAMSFSVGLLMAESHPVGRTLGHGPMFVTIPPEVMFSFYITHLLLILSPQVNRVATTRSYGSTMPIGCGSAALPNRITTGRSKILPPAPESSWIRTSKFTTHNRNNSATALSIQWIYNWTGHEWLNEDRTEVLLDDPGVAELLEFWRDLQVNQHVIPYAGGFPPRSFDQGGYAITEQYLSLAFSLEEVAFDWIVTLLPKAPYAQKSHAQAHMFSMANGTSQLDAAWRLIEWMASYEGQKAMVEILLRQPLGPYPELWDSFRSLEPEKAMHCGLS